MDASADGSLYRVERDPELVSIWRVVGPNGFVAAHLSEHEAQAHANALNAEVAEERENDA